ncbi:hypothetical protein [Nocardia asteroides]|uniref:hypothetical protein n=1 Tax=Nocardia asteroides TaxID=1824 RepID=UPI001E5A6860|nr:hypothetical protein [Nocardia asteroides]UGT59487.1 hypothetical protein LTT61_19775 [Nocardia asteroides]
MSYDLVLLPSGVASTVPAAEEYLDAQEGKPESAAVAEIAAELNRRNGELPEDDSFLSVSPIGGHATGDTLPVAMPYDAIGFGRALLFELATPRGYALFDPQLAWLIDPAGHLPLAVSHGGAGEFPYLTERLAEDWVAGLAAPNPYLVVDRGPNDYIQTYREDSGEYTLEYRDGAADRHFGTVIPDAGTVAALIWDWARGERTRFDRVTWSPVEL